MAKISALPDAAPFSGRERLPVVQDDETRGAAIDDIIAPAIAELDARVAVIDDGTTLHRFRDAAGREIGAIVNGLDGRPHLVIGGIDITAEIDAMRAGGTDLDMPDLYARIDAAGQMLYWVDESGGFRLPGLDSSVQALISGLIGAATSYRLYTFIDADGPGWKLRAYRGTDRVNFLVEDEVTYTGLPAGHSIRDPEVKFMRGRYWLVHSAFGFATGTDAAGFDIAVSLDGKNFVFVTTVWLPPLINGALTAWAPSLFEDLDGTVRVTIAVWFGVKEKNDRGQDTAILKSYSLYATSPTLRDWALAGQITGELVPANSIDGCLAHYKGRYYLAIKDEKTRRLKLLWGTSPIGPFDQGRDIVLANTSIEGPQLDIDPGLQACLRISMARCG